AGARLTREQWLRRLVEEALVGCGCSEIYTPSLVGSDPDPNALRLPTPLTSDQAVLRTTLLEGLVASARNNVDAGNEGVRLFEIDLPSLFARVPERLVYEDVITYPALRQDLAFSVAEDVAAGDLVAAAREAAGPELREMRPFDVYRGEQVGEGRKSIAFAVSFQSSERTLSDEDAAALRKRIVDALAKRFGAELRE